MRVARFGDNMRYVAVTEGDKTEAEAIFGVQINTWGVMELAAAVERSPTPRSTPDRRVPRPVRGGADAAPGRGPSRLAAVRRGDRGRPANFLEDGGFTAFTTRSRTSARCASFPASPSSG